MLEYGYIASVILMFEDIDSCDQSREIVVVFRVDMHSVPLCSVQML